MADQVAAEPTVMWRMRRGGMSAHLVVGLQRKGAWAAWFLNDQPIGVRDFPDVGSALRFSDRMRVQNWSIGWRLDTQRDDAPPISSR